MKRKSYNLTKVQIKEVMAHVHATLATARVFDKVCLACNGKFPNKKRKKK